MQPAPEPTPPARPSLFRHPWRVAVVVIALLVVLNLGIVAIRSADTTKPGTEGLPQAVTSITPESGELTGLVDDVSVDLRDDLTGVLVLDRIEIPEDQLDRVEALGRVSFRPGPDRELERFRAGEHVVTVRYWPRGAERPEQPASYSWRFRAAA